MTDRILYQSFAEPVPEDPSRNMIKWWRPASEPQMNQLKKYAIVMAAASGAVLNPYPLPNPVPDLIATPQIDIVRRVDTRTAPWQVAFYGEELPIPTPPNPAMWEPLTNEWPRQPIGLKAAWQQALAFVDWQSFIRASDGDVYVKQIQDNQWLDEKLLDEKRRLEWERFREEMRFNRERREDIESALNGPPIEYKWPEQPGFYKTPNTLPLAADVVRAQAMMQQVLAQKQAEEEERQLEQLLLGL